MNGIISWFTRNGVAANLLMATIIMAGVFTVAYRVPLEVFPDFAIDRITVNMPYRGATPSEVEEGVVIRIEEAIQDNIYLFRGCGLSDDRGGQQLRSARIA